MVSPYFPTSRLFTTIRGPIWTFTKGDWYWDYLQKRSVKEEDDLPTYLSLLGI